jgi:hypothetical protein
MTRRVRDAGAEYTHIIYQAVDFFVAPLVQERRMLHAPAAE